MACESHGNYDAGFHSTHQSRAQLALFPSSFFCLSSLLSPISNGRIVSPNDANLYASVPPPGLVPIIEWKRWSLMIFCARATRGLGRCNARA